MSSNDYIFIKWNGKKYWITHRDYDTTKVLEKIGNTKNLEEAVRKANRYTKALEEIPEYGLIIFPKPRKRKRKYEKEEVST